MRHRATAANSSHLIEQQFTKLYTQNIYPGVYWGSVFHKMSNFGCGVCFTMHRMCDSPPLENKHEMCCRWRLLCLSFMNPESVRISIKQQRKEEKCNELGGKAAKVAELHFASGLHTLCAGAATDYVQHNQHFLLCFF